MAQIAARVNISPATVSRVLNGKALDFISDATREKVLSAAQEMGYRTNMIAKGLVTGRTNLIAFWTRNPDAPYYARMIRTVQAHVAESGFEMVLACFPDRGSIDFQRLDSDLDNLMRWPLDGIIAADCRTAVERFLSRRGVHAPPIVGIGNDYADALDHVGLSVEQDARLAVEHLVKIGRRHIVHLTAGCAIASVQAGRAAAYEAVLREAGLQPEYIRATDETRNAAREAVREFHRWRGTPDALFALNDDLAIGAYRGLRDLGLRVPEDVAIAGVDGIPDVEYLDVPLTTLKQPVEEMCALAWQFLKNRITNSETPPAQRCVLHSRLIISASTGELAACDRVAPPTEAESGFACAV